MGDGLGYGDAEVFGSGALGAGAADAADTGPMSSASVSRRERAATVTLLCVLGWWSDMGWRWRVCGTHVGWAAVDMADTTSGCALWLRAVGWVGGGGWAVGPAGCGWLLAELR